MTRAKPTRPKSPNREVNKLIKQAWAAGWRTKAKPNGHVKLFSPDGRSIVTVPVTPSDHRAVKNLRAQFRRAGLKV